MILEKALGLESSLVESVIAEKEEITLLVGSSKNAKSVLEIWKTTSAIENSYRG